MINKDAADQAHECLETGRQARRTGAPSPWPATDKLRTLLYCTGWLYEDLRLTLLKRDPSYRQRPIFPVCEASKTPSLT